MSGGGCCYYSVLGLCKQASADEIRAAYCKLAMKWHPDRWIKDPEMAAESKARFQQIQHAYSVLSNKGKRSIYDAGLISFLTDEDDEGFCDFMIEMVSLMKSATEQGKKKKKRKNSLEDLKGSLMAMMGADEQVEELGLDWGSPPPPPPLNATKRSRFVFFLRFETRFSP
ncbi:chaperone protein DnaJ-like [Benincasa hispida]|uniref:chaperone protein DnaJ-like n=1 Tax=Benincasa hispida TaxID=102211 RepID=UPI00190051BE|nr:chaperone protein DnaJ-like [Benincasa hispida]